MRDSIKRRIDILKKMIEDEYSKNNDLLDYEIQNISKELDKIIIEYMRNEVDQ